MSKATPEQRIAIARANAIAARKAITKLAAGPVIPADVVYLTAHEEGDTRYALNDADGSVYASTPKSGNQSIVVEAIDVARRRGDKRIVFGDRSWDVSCLAK